MRTTGREESAQRPASPEPIVDLFVYGTLLFPEVLDALLGRVPPHRPATAPGWRVAALPGRLYPGLVADPDAVAPGSVLGGLDGGECRLLDAYEDVDYRRTAIALADGTRCSAYVWHADVLSNGWEPQLFAAAHLVGYVQGCRRWLADHLARHSVVRGHPDR